SNSVGMDIDFAKDLPKEELESATKMMIGRVLQMKDDIGLLMLERSATKGLHIVFKRIGWLNQEENLEWAQKMLGVEFDKGAKDITRVFFTPTASEEDLLFLSDDLFINKEVETAANPPAVGADPCVRPTTVGRTESAKEVEAKDGNGKEEANAKSAEICRSDIGRTHGSAPTGGSCTQSTTGGSCTQSTTGGACTQSTTGGSCTQSTTGGSCMQSTTGGSCTQSTTGGNLEYNGIPYSSIVTEFLRQFNNGQTPVEGNRNVMTFELAKALRSICDYNLDFMKEVIPRYDNFPEEEYVKTLQSAIDEPRRGVSYKLQKVLEVLYRKDKKTEGKVDFETENELPPAMPQRLPYPLGFLSAKVPEMYRPAVCEAVFAPLSTYVHSVKFRYWDGVEHEPTFMSVLTAPMSIGKGCVRKPISIILDELVKKDESNRARESEWKQKNPSSKQKRDPRPSDICVQVLIDNLTDAVFNQRVYDADKNGQRYLYTSVDELDTLKKITSRGTASEVSVIIRKSFDNSKHGQERVGADSVTGIAPLRFNFNASTTNRNFQQFFAREMTTGTVTRLSLATIIKPSDAKRPVFKEYDAAYIEEVRKLTQKLSMLSGEISCPKCNKFAEQLCDENEQLASLYGSDPYLVLSYRATVIAWLKGMMLYVMNGEKWTKEIQDYMEWSLRYDLWVKMHVIGKMLDAAFDDEENATSKRGPMNMLTLLKDEFTMEDLILVRKKLGKSVDKRAVKNQLSLWKSRNFIKFDNFEGFIKKI
ncbi:MAG: PSA repeat domain-containing protein, partial [Prevotella sp.]